MSERMITLQCATIRYYALVLYYMDSIYKKLKIRVNALARVHGNYPGINKKAISMIGKIIFAMHSKVEH